MRNQAIAFCIAAALTAASPAAGQAAGAPPTPCLQALQTQDAKDQAKPRKSGGLGKWLAGAAGVGLGVLVGSGVCGKDSQGRRDLGCMAGLAAGGGLLGFQLGKQLDENDRKKVQEATYAAAFTGRPQALSLSKGCMVVQPAEQVDYETRDVQLGFAQAVAAPTGTVRAIGAPMAPLKPLRMTLAPTAPGRGAAPIPANQPRFALGTVGDGKWLLVASGSRDQGFVATGYAPAADWRQAPPEAELGASAMPAAVKTLTLKAEVPCRVHRSVLRTEDGRKARQEVAESRLCTLPDGQVDLPAQAAT